MFFQFLLAFSRIQQYKSKSTNINTYDQVAWALQIKFFPSNLMYNPGEIQGFVVKVAALRPHQMIL